MKLKNSVITYQGDKIIINSSDILHNTFVVGLVPESRERYSCTNH